MPRLRRLSGKAVVEILERFDFEVIHTSGSHYRLRRTVGGKEQSITVPIHGNKQLKLPTLSSIYRQARRYIPETDLKPYFYTD